MRVDSEIQRDVQAELNWAPDVDSTDIAVKAKDGTVTLTGFVTSGFQKYRAERAARRVKGVSAVANDIEVRLPGAAPTDPTIARAAATLIRSNLGPVAEGIHAMVHDGRVALVGEVEWHYQRELVETLMHRVEGVISVRNSIHVKPKTTAPADIKARIEAAFRRLADVDAHKIAVEVAGSEIVLRGEVRSWAERDQAQATAWAAPGVTRVANELTVRT
ncbi:MAG: BON domain-containing protein [Proteobacteria bacterium]|nr:BON domain-containing protein [Pseudomonadota bacterium]